MPRHFDFTVMYAAHDAFRRDTDRLRDAAAAGAGADPAVLKGWRTFRRELHLHHLAEDTALWPSLRAALTDRAAADLSVLEAMDTEHQRLDSLVAGVEEALTAGDQSILAQRAEDLALALDDHLEREEELALPLIQAALPEEGWLAYKAESRRLHGLRGAAVYLPWLLDGTPLGEQRRLLSLLPPPARVLYRTLWRPRYLGRRLWAFPAG